MCQSSVTNTRREFAGERETHHQPHTLSNHIQSTHPIYCSSGERELSLPPIKGKKLAHIFRERPIIPYKRSKSLRDILFSTKLTGRTPEGHTTTMGSCGPCNKPKCSWCVLVNKTSTFTGRRRDAKVFDIFHTVNCHSTFVIYIIECRICRLQYVGKSETAFNLRLNNYRNHIKKGVNSCELTEHFPHNRRSHDFDKDVIITIIEQIKRSNMTIERKKEILRAREIFLAKSAEHIATERS